MSGITLASKGYVDSSVPIATEYTDTKTGEVTISSPILNQSCMSIQAMVYHKPVETLKLTHLSWPYFTTTIDNVYLGIAPTKFTSGTPELVTEEPLLKGYSENVWFKLSYPVYFYNNDDYEGWENYSYIDIIPKSPVHDVHMLEKTVVDGETIYTSLGKINPRSTVDCKNSLDPKNVVFSTTGEEIDFSNYKCGRIYPYYTVYPNIDTCFGVRYEILKKGPVVIDPALVTTAYVNSKLGLTGGDSSLASKEYVDSLS